jgi:hypothetical protein
MICGATDGYGLKDDDDSWLPYNRCMLPLGHDTNGWHREMRDGKLWAEWRGPGPDERCGICGKFGSEH